MANTFKTILADNLSATASALVSKDMSLAGVVNRSWSADFAGKRGATVNVRIPAALTASSRALDASTALTISTLSETTQPVSLTTNIYSAVALSDEDLTLRIEDGVAQVLAPQTLAVAEAVENLVVAKLQSVTEAAALDSIYTMGTVGSLMPLFLLARKTLRDMSAPATGLYAAVGTGVYADVLAQVSAVGAEGGADPFANTGAARIAGFNVIESNRLNPTEAIFFHRDAITLALRAPVVPQGVPYGASIQAQGGVPVRLIRDYDASALGDRQILNVYAGAALMNAQVSSTGTPVNFVLRVNDGAGA
jgi:hypothetical protein